MNINLVKLITIYQEVTHNVNILSKSESTKSISITKL
jgi:hypothetical protein